MYRPQKLVTKCRGDVCIRAYTELLGLAVADSARDTSGQASCSNPGHILRNLKRQASEQSLVRMSSQGGHFDPTSVTHFIIKKKDTYITSVGGGRSVMFTGLVQVA